MEEGRKKGGWERWSNGGKESECMCVRERKREGAKRGRKKMCGEIIIPSVTVATFYEVDVNKRELHNPFQF